MRRTILLSLIIVLCVGHLPVCAATLAEVRTSVRLLLYETDSTNTIYADALLNNNINLAQALLVDALPLSAHWGLITSGTIAVTVGTASYSLPATFRRMIAVRVNQKPAVQIKPSEYFAKLSRASMTDPMWTLMDGKIYIVPTPTAVTQTCEVIYQKAVTVMTSDAHTTTLDAAYDRLLAICAAYLTLLNDGQAARAAALEKSMLNLLQGIREGMLNTNVIEPVPPAPSVK